MKIALVLLLLGFASAAPPNQQVYRGEEVEVAEQPVAQLVNKNLTPEQKNLLTEELVNDYENEVVRMYTLKTLAEGFKLEEAAEEKIIQAAVETLQEEPSPERTQRLQEVGELLRRDKRAVQVLSGLLGSSSGGGGDGSTASASAGSDSGSILSLVGPLLGSSSGGGTIEDQGGDENDSGSILSISLPLSTSSSDFGGGGGSGGDGASAAAGSDSGSILGLVGPLLGSSSGGGGSGGDGSSNSGGSGSGSILGLVGPLLGSSSGGGGGSTDGGASVSGGSDSGSILNLILPLISSSSSSGGGGDGGGSGLGSILSLSSSSKPGVGGGAGGGGGVAVDGDQSGGGAGVIGQIKGAKIALVGDKINLLMRAKFGLINKVLTTITNKIAVASLPPNAWNMDLKYPNP
ncbi:unnamed protein product [Nezara viridula]|uniref:Neuropeptide n=1 Tax=Nezara viridula TaxID=85310 RepID=A0A9P0E7M3_NEZVI|nr:unnamed protein product [Nezara viridula]